MVNPVPVVAFVVFWHLIVGLVSLTATPVPDQPSCSVVDVLTGCSDTFSAFVLGTIPSAPAELNQIILFIDFVILVYFLWTFIVLVRGGASD